MNHDARITAFEAHVQSEHRQHGLLQYFKEVVYGGIDGIITTFAVVAGFSGAALSTEATTQLSFMVVLLFGAANLFADGVSMGLGNFLSVRSDQSLYRRIRAKEAEEIRVHPDSERHETVTILLKKGFSEDDAETLATIYQKNETYWLDFMMNHELETPDPTGDNPLLTGLATFLSFVFFGTIPLLPFIFLHQEAPQHVFLFSSLATGCALLLLGVLKWKVTGVRAWAALCEVFAVGVTAAGIAFFVGSLFSL